MLRNIITCTVLSCFIAAMAHAEIKPYIGLSGGLSLLSDSEITSGGFKAAETSFDTGYVFELAAGAQFGMDIDTIRSRIELALSQQGNDIDEIVDYTTGTSGPADGEVLATALMLNGYLDFPIQHGLTPYILAGIGGAHVDMDIDRDDVLAGQLGAGIGYALTDKLILDLKYKYFMTEKVALIGDIAKGTVAGHHVMVGLRYQF